jgi:hypothetical protein
MSADAQPIQPVGVGEAALRDAEKITTRIAADEEAANAAQEAYAAGGLPSIEPDDGARAVLLAGEQLHSVHGSAVLEAPTEEEDALPHGGTLYLTSARLLHIGSETTDVPLSEIVDVTVGLERLVLIRRLDGSDLAVEVDQPRLLRVQLVTALSAIRASQP